MKISSYYLNDISEYENFISKIDNDIHMKFYNTGFNSLNLRRFVNYIRKEFSKYIDIKFNKTFNVVILLPKNDNNLIEKIFDDKKEKIQIYLCYDKIKNILSGNYSNYTEYLNEIIEQIESIVQDNETHDFNDYLIIKMDKLAELSASELKCSYSKDFLLNNIKKPTSWVKLARQSAIFKDYYNFYKQDKENNKKYFILFLKQLYLLI